LFVSAVLFSFASGYPYLFTSPTFCKFVLTKRQMIQRPRLFYYYTNRHNVVMNWFSKLETIYDPYLQCTVKRNIANHIRQYCAVWIHVAIVYFFNFPGITFWTKSRCKMRLISQ
jgi:hypothetical protein